MAVDKAVDDLKKRPEGERKAVASGVAVALVIILFIGWAYFFLKKVRGGVTLDEIGTSEQQKFNFTNVQNAREQLQDSYGSAVEELRRIREEAVRGAAGTVETQTVDVGGTRQGGFGISEDGY